MGFKINGMKIENIFKDMTQLEKKFKISLDNRSKA